MSSREKSHAVPASRSTSSSGSRSRAWSTSSVSMNGLGVVVALLQPAERDALGARPLDLVEEVVDRLVARGRDPDPPPARSAGTIRRAPVHVFPEPGGPWTTR